MIRVTVELVPWGMESAKRTLGYMKIVNDGTGDRDIGHYDVSTWRVVDDEPHPPRVGRVTDHSREQGVFDLILKALAVTKP